MNSDSWPSEASRADDVSQLEIQDEICNYGFIIKVPKHKQSNFSLDLK